MARVECGIDGKGMDTWRENVPADIAVMSASQLSSQSTAQAIHKNESLEIVQTLLHGSVGTCK